MERSIRTLADGRRLDVVEVGDPDGPPIVHFHGTPSSPLELAGAEAAALDVGVRVVCAARPGYADSTPVEGHGLERPAADMLELTGILGIDAFAALGVSGGGPYAAALALASPARVTGLGLLAGAGPRELWNLDDPLSAEELRLVDVVAGGDQAAHDEAIAAIEAGILPFVDGVRTDPPPPMPAAIAASIVDGARNGLRGYVYDVLSQGLPWDIDVAAIAVPTRLVYGGADGNVPPSHGRWYAARIPGATLTIVEGADHPGTIASSYRDMFAFLAAPA